MIKNLEDLFPAVLKRPKRTLIVVSANDTHSVEAAGKAVGSDLVNAVLIGDENVINVP